MTDDPEVMAAAHRLYAAIAAALVEFITKREPLIGAVIADRLSAELGKRETARELIDSLARPVAELIAVAEQQQPRPLQRAHAGADVRDEDVAVETVKVGGRMLARTTILREWIDNGGAAAVPVVVTDVRRDAETGIKTMTVGLEQ